MKRSHDMVSGVADEDAYSVCDDPPGHDSDVIIGDENTENISENGVEADEKPPPSTIEPNHDVTITTSVATSMADTTDNASASVELGSEVLVDLPDLHTHPNDDRLTTTVFTRSEVVAMFNDLRATCRQGGDGDAAAGPQLRVSVNLLPATATHDGNDSAASQSDSNSVAPSDSPSNSNYEFGVIPPCPCCVCLGRCGHCNRPVRQLRSTLGPHAPRAAADDATTEPGSRNDATDRERGSPGHSGSED